MYSKPNSGAESEGSNFLKSARISDRASQSHTFEFVSVDIAVEKDRDYAAKCHAEEHQNHDVGRWSVKTYIGANTAW